MNHEPLSDKTYKRFCDLVYAKAGIHLGLQKEALVAARMGKRMRSLGLSSYEAYFRAVQADETGDELVEMLNAISTNVTFFFRENRHFDLLTALLRQWSDRGQSVFRIWCAAASTGEEPYSIAMTVKSALKNTRDCKILATDISTRALEVARRGCYEARHMEKVPERFLRLHFQKERREQGAPYYKINEDLKRMITYARVNLAAPPYPMRGPFDVVFCRNVMIYFDNTVRKALLTDIWRLLKPGGYLMVGHAESLSGMLSDFRSVEPSVYIK